MSDGCVYWPSQLAMIVEKIKEGSVVEHYETQRGTKDGRDVRDSVSVSHIRNTNGRVVGASTIARDVRTGL